MLKETQLLAERLSEFLETRSSDTSLNASLKTLLAVTRVLCRIQDHPDDPTEAEAQLSAALLSVTNSRSLHAFTKRLKRLEKSLPAPDLDEEFSLSAALVKYAAPEMTSGRWERLLDKHTAWTARIEQVLFAYSELLLPPVNKNSKLIIRVGTTPLLSERIWPEIISQFRAREPFDSVQLVITTKSAHSWLNHRSDAEKTQDFILVYGEEMFGTSAILKKQLSRCIALPRGTFRKSEHPDVIRDLSASVSSLRIATPPFRDLILKSFPWARVVDWFGGGEDVRRSQFEMHAYVRSGLGGCVTHEELISPSDDPHFDVIPLPSDNGRSFGASSLLLFAGQDASAALSDPKCSRNGQRGASWGVAIDELRNCIDSRFEEMSRIKSIADDWSRELKALTRCKLEFGEEALFGACSLQGSALGAIKGEITVDGANETLYLDILPTGFKGSRNIHLDLTIADSPALERDHWSRLKGTSGVSMGTDLILRLLKSGFALSGAFRGKPTSGQVIFLAETPDA